MDIGSHQEWMEIAEARSGAAGHDKEKCIGVFYDKAVQDKEATEREGRAVYNLVPYVEILIPGAPNQKPNMKATEEHKLRFPKAWAAYLERRKGLADGTPLEQWPYLNQAQIAELKHAGVFSVEQLSAVADGNLKNLGLHGRELRTRAQQFLQGASETEKELRQTVADQAAALANLQAQIDQLTKVGTEMPRIDTTDHDAHDEALAVAIEATPVKPKPVAKRRGRPPKNRAA